MWKKLATLSGAGLLTLAGCGADTKTFLANTTAVPADEAEASQDFDGDAEIDNNLPTLAAQLGTFGIDLEVLLNGAIADGTVLIAMDVSSKNFENDEKKAAVTAYLASSAAVPVFDGTDVISVEGDEFIFGDVKVINGNLSTGQSNFVFALPLDPVAPTLLPFSNSILTGNVSGDTLTGGTLSGVVASDDFGAVLGEVGTLVASLIESTSADLNGGTADACTSTVANNALQQEDCAAGQVCSASDGASSGFCLNGGLATALPLLDANHNGTLEVEFDAAGKVFVTNELSLLFDDDNNQSLDVAGPLGLVGNLFDVDIDANGVRDSLPLGIFFDAVLATRQ